MPVALPHIAERLFSRAHAIEPNAFRAIVDGPVARRVLAGEAIESKEATKRANKIRRERMSTIVSAEPVKSQDGIINYALTDDGVAVLSIEGALSRRFDWLAAACGWTTYDALGASLDAVMSDYRVRGVLLDVDSPGGEASGMLDVADKIIAARQVKPIWAVANTFAASAAYALAGSAERLVLPRLAQVGSIGCVIVHVDQSVQDEAIGLNYTAIYSGARKIDGWGHAPLSEAAQKSFQADADHCRRAFADLIGRQGRISSKAALATEAEVYSDDLAVKVGLADAVGTFDDALAEFTDLVTKNPSSTTFGAAAPQREIVAMSTKEAPAAQAAKIEVPISAVVEPVAVIATGAAGELAPNALMPVAHAPLAAAKPAPGETCQACGQVMPDDDDGMPADPSAAVYTVDMVIETLDLCAIAKTSFADARKLIKANSPIAAVREALTKTAAAATDAQPVSGIAPPAGKTEADVEKAWDDVVTAQNAKLPQRTQR